MAPGSDHEAGPSTSIVDLTSTGDIHIQAADFDKQKDVGDGTVHVRERVERGQERVHTCEDLD